MDQVRPGRLAVYVPERPRALTGALLDHLKQLSQGSGLPLQMVTKAELLAAFGLPALKKRAELHAIIEQLWPTVREVGKAVKPYIADAAATAWLADTMPAVPGPP